MIVERLPDPERALNTRVTFLSPRYTATHAKYPLPRNANLPARKRMSLVAATAVAAAGIGAVTATAGTAHWTNAISNLAQDRAAASTVQQTGTAHLDAYVPGPEIGIAGMLEYGAAQAQGNTTAFGNISTGQHRTGGTTLATVRQPTRGTAFGNISTAERSAGTTTDSTATAPQVPAAHAAAAAPAPAHAAPAPAHATTAAAHAAPVAAHVAAAPAHAAPAPAHAAPAHTAKASAAPAHAAPAHHAAPAPPAARPSRI